MVYCRSSVREFRYLRNPSACDLSRKSPIPFVVYKGSGVFIKYGVAARGCYMFFNFVNVLLVVKYDGVVAFVSRKESKLGSLFRQGLQSSTLFGGKVVRSHVLFGIVVCKDGGCLVNGRGFHSVREAFHYILDERG